MIFGRKQARDFFCKTRRAAEVRERFRRVKPLGEIKAKERGWTLDMLNVVRRLVESRRRGLPGRSFGAKTGNETPSKKPGIDQSLLTSSPTTEFTTADADAFTRELEKLHPDSRVILETDSPRHHRLAVPDHNPLRIGTLNASRVGG